MFSNFYVKTKKFIKEYYKSIIFFIVLYIFFMFPVNYYILVGGGIMPVGDRIQIEDEYKSKGSFNLAYVTETRGTIATYLLSYIMPDWKRIKVSDYTYDEEESTKDVDFRSKIDLLNANSYAIKNAYNEAEKSYTVIDTDLYVYYVDKDSKNDFKVGDKILKVQGNSIKNANEYRDTISNYKVNDTIKVLVERNNREKELSIKLYKKGNTIITGIYVNSVESYKTYPKIKIKFRNSESGPSGGLVETLDIYNKLTKKDITKGYTIAATGEIDNDGNISSIGGVKYKLLGAVKKKADIFIVPKGKNYNTCIKLKKKRKLKIKIIGVSTFKEAVRKLNKI